MSTPQIASLIKNMPNKRLRNWKRKERESLSKEDKHISRCY
jgi:hypothetical protein